MTKAPSKKKQQRLSLAALYSGKPTEADETSVPDNARSPTKASEGGLPGIVLGKISARRGELVQIEPTVVEDLFPPDRISMAFKDDAYASLKESIRTNGQDQPILVRPKPGHQGRYQIAFGRRRRAACAELETSLKAIVAELTDDQMLQVMIRENDVRSAVSTYERSVFYKELMKSEEIGVRVLARRLDVSPAMISRLTSLSDLPESLLGILGDPRPLGVRLLERLGEVVSSKEKFDRAMKAWPRLEPRETPSDRALQFLALATETENVSSGKKQHDLAGSNARIGRVTWQGERCRLVFDKDLGEDRIQALLEMLTQADV